MTKVLPPLSGARTVVPGGRIELPTHGFSNVFSRVSPRIGLYHLPSCEE